MPVSSAPQILETSRLILRRFTRADAAAYFAIFSQPDVARYTSRPPFTQLAEAEQRVSEIIGYYANDQGFQLALERKSDAQLIGACTLHAIHHQNRRAELGYSLGRACWQNGYMHEALCALVDYAFRSMNLHRLEADIDPRNVASEKSLARLGFAREGLMRERWIVAGEISDSAVYGLLARDWLARAER
jgi:ribosomal-protein-alanine N-acetyltransferase